jgi:antitoxin MazE
MKTDLQRIGNSRGVVIPKAILDKCGFDRQVDMRVEGDKLILTPAKGVRAGWSDAFEREAKAAPVAPLLPDHLNEQWDSEEWTW